MEREVLFTGVGGQGVQLAAEVLARAAILEGREVMMLGTYGGTMRGGSTDVCLVLADAPIVTPPIVSRAWAAVVVHDRFFGPAAKKLASGSLVFANRDWIENEIEIPGVTLHAVEASRVAAEVATSMTSALVLTAAFAGGTQIVGIESLVEAMRECVPSYRAQHLEANEKALRAGFAWPSDGVALAWAEEAA